MVLSPLDDPALEAHLAALPPDGLTIFTLGSPEGPPGGELRGAFLNGTRMVSQMRANHRLGILETYVLGQAYLAAGLLSSTLKGEDSLSIRLDCEGPVHGFSVEARAEPAGGGAVRGYLFQDAIPLDAPPESFDLAPLVGSGTLTMTRFIAGTSRPFTGSIALKTGRIAQDLAAYFLESEQVQTAFDLGIQFDPAGRVAGAGALYLQALPGATPSFLERAEAAIAALPSLGRACAEGRSPAAVLSPAFGSLGYEPRGSAPLAFSCRCSRERFGDFITSSKGGLLEDLIENGPWPAEAHCHNCGTRYRWSREELEAMRETGS